MSNEGVKREVTRMKLYVSAERNQAKTVFDAIRNRPDIPVERVERLRRRLVLLNNLVYWMDKATEEVAALINETGKE